MSILRYSAAFIDWNKEELKEFDRKTRKYLTIYNALHPRDSVARLYLPRKMGGRGLCSIEDCVELARLGLFNYCAKSREKLLGVAARGDECDGLESTTEFKKRMTDERAGEVRRKELHGKFFRQTGRVASNKSWTWPQQGYLKKETEGLLMAAQTQSLRTDAVKAKIDRSQKDSLCRIC